jgi:hypothetical protein
MLELLQTVAAERTRKGAVNLVQLLRVMPPEWLHWKPLDCGRTVIEQAIECILVNRKWALTLRQGVYTRVPVETVEQVKTTCQDSSQVSQLLQEAAEELAAAILALPVTQLDEQIHAPFGTYSVADCCLLGYWNMVYHEGQINYIQTLYGDQATHVHF